MIKVFNLYNSSSANGCYFCMTLCVAIATAQERKIWFIQEAYLLYISWGIVSMLALHCGDRIEHCSATSPISNMYGGKQSLKQLKLKQHVCKEQV